MVTCLSPNQKSHVVPGQPREGQEGRAGEERAAPWIQERGPLSPSLCPSSHFRREHTGGYGVPGREPGASALCRLPAV